MIQGERLGHFLSALPLMHIPRDKHQGLRNARREIGITMRRGRRARIIKPTHPP